MALGVIIDRGRIYGFRLKRGKPFQVKRVVDGVEAAVAETPCPEPLEGMRILLISDLHVHSPGKGLVVEKAVEALGEPDIVVVAGDTWDEKTKRVGDVAETLEKLRGIGRARVAVLGNHEHWAGEKRIVDLGEGVAVLEENGFQVLRDATVEYRGIVIAGVDWSEELRPSTVEGLASTATVLVAHTPDVFPYASRYPVLVLAGHTHGGQYCLPGARSVITNSRHGYTWGVYREGRAVMVVSRGLGEMRESRIMCPRQVVLVACTSGEKG